MLYNRGGLSSGATKEVESHFESPIPEDLNPLIREILDEWGASVEQRPRDNTLSDLSRDMITYVRLEEEEIELPPISPLEWHLSVEGEEPFLEGVLDFVLAVGAEAQRTKIAQHLKDEVVKRLGIRIGRFQFSQPLVILPAPSWGPPLDPGYREDPLCTLQERTSLARRVIGEMWRFADLPDVEPPWTMPG